MQIDLEGYYTKNEKLVKSGRGLGHATYYSNFGNPNIWNGLRYKLQILHMDWR